MNHIIDKNNVRNESFYNLVQLVRLLEYADPIGAITALSLTVEVVKDECGNIITLAK